MKKVKARFFWKPSPSSKAAKQRFELTTDGNIVQLEFEPGIGEHVVDFDFVAEGSFKIVTLDAQGNEVSSSTFSFTAADLEMLPATGLGFEVLEVVDVPDAPPA